MAGENTDLSTGQTNGGPPSTGVVDTGTGLRFTATPMGEPNPTLEERAAALDKENGVEGASEEDTGPKLPEGYTDWAEYGKDLAAGKVKLPAGEEALKEDTSKADGEETPEAKTAREAFEAKQAPFTREVLETGTLSDESVAKAAQEFGVTEDMVRQYLAGAQVAAQQANAPIIEAVGGDWDKFNGWVVDNLTEAQQGVLNKALAGDKEVALAALAPYAEQFRGDGGANPPSTLTRAAGVGSQKGDAFENMAQQVAAQSDQRYDSDPAYRKSVVDRIARSNY